MAIKFKATKFNQGDKSLYLFTARAKEIWGFSSINQKEDDKIGGYQRALSESRAEDIQKYIEGKNTIAPAIILSFDEDKACFNEETHEIEINDFKDSAWVIDGQHRLRGSSLADSDDFHVNLPVVAYIGLDIKDQIRQFVTINREAKGVPTSLYYDLLSSLPPKSKPGDQAKEVAADIANTLRKDPDSIFFEKIVIVTSPKKGQMSLNNFVRKVHPLIYENKGSLSMYSQKEVVSILENYFRALKSVFPDEFSLLKERFFGTLGFGAVINALPTIFLITLKEKSGFRFKDIKAMLEKSEEFNFSDWDNIGTGSAAENQAGRDFQTHFKNSINDEGPSQTIRL